MEADPIDLSRLREGSVVVIRAFDDIPEHLFRVAEVYDDCIGGHSIRGLAGVLLRFLGRRGGKRTLERGAANRMVEPKGDKRRKC